MAPAAAESRPMYQRDEKALCFHGELLYEAKVLEVRRQDSKDKSGPHEYRVHYKGWKNTWDDWVPQDRLRKLTDDNKELAANLRRELVQPAAPKSAAKPTPKSRRQGSEADSERNSSVPAGGRGTKRGRDNDIEKVGPRKISISYPINLDDESGVRLRDLRIPLFPVQNPLGHLPGAEYGEDFGDEMPRSRLRFGSALPARTIQRMPRISIIAASEGRLDRVAKQNTNLENSGPKIKIVPDSDNESENEETNGQVSKEQSPLPTMQNKSERHQRAAKARWGKVLEPALNDEKARQPANQIKTERHQRAAKSRWNKEPEPASDDELDTFALVDDLLARDPPPDEPEYISTATSRAGVFWAPLIGGTTMEEKAAIERELSAAGKFDVPEKYHPGYIKTRGEDPGNFNKLTFFELQDPTKKLAVAGASREPLQIDPPGSGGPFDALKHPDRLVELVNRGQYLHGWNAKVIKKIPKRLMEKIDPDMLAHIGVAPAMEASFPDIFAHLKLPDPPSRTPSLILPLAPDLPLRSFQDSYAYKSLIEQEEAFQGRPSIRFPIPDHIKNLLVDDWENVTKSLLLVPLPSRAPANFIIDSYFNEEKGNRRLGSAEADILVEFCDGLKVYFEKSVGKILLYRFERPQLAEIRKLWESGKNLDWEDKGPGDAYGAEHLARMLVNMPEMIAQTNLDIPSINRLREELSKFCTWLARHSNEFFCAKYEKPSADYIEHAR